MNKLNDEHNATYISGLLFKARLAMIDAKSNNGYACFDLKSIELLVELKDAIDRAIQEIGNSNNS